MEESDEELRFLTVRNRYFKMLSNIEEKIKLRNATSKKIYEIDFLLKKELEEMEELEMEREFKTDELYYD